MILRFDSIQTCLQPRPCATTRTYDPREARPATAASVRYQLILRLSNNLSVQLLREPIAPGQAPPFSRVRSPSEWQVVKK